MDFRHPLSVITPTLDGDVLAILGAAEISLTGRELARRAVASQEGVRVALERLVGHGVVLKDRAGAAFLFRLNRQHLAAPYIEGLVGLRLELLKRVRETIRAWPIPARAALLFGSAARKEAGPVSDVDFLIIREDRSDADDSGWRDQLTALEAAVWAWTGNDARVLEYSAAEFAALRGKEPVLINAIAEGIELFGSLPRTRTPRRRRAKS